MCEQFQVNDSVQQHHFVKECMHIRIDE